MALDSGANPLDLTGRVILVTGASAGLGRAVALTLARLGARLVLVARDRVRLEAVARDLPGSGHVVAPVDLADIDAIPGRVAELARDHGPFSGLVHAAGLMAPKPLKLVGAADWESVFRVNVFAAGALAKAYRRPGVVAPGGGAVVFFASVAGLSGEPAQSVYGASKGAVVALTKSLAVELAREGIRVNAVAPGAVDGGMTATIRERLSPEQFAQLVAAHPLGLGTPADVAGAVAFLLADTGRWITGTTLVVDGGYLAG